MKNIYDWIDAIVLGILGVMALMMTLALIRYSIEWLVKAVK